MTSMTSTRAEPSVIDRLTRLLWPDGDTPDGMQVHWLLDGARDPAIATLLRQGKLEYTCLYESVLSPRLQAAAPYLVHLSAGSPTTVDLLARGWGRAWGIFCVAAPHLTLTRLRTHFKKLLRVRTEDGKVLAFRFYDPAVLGPFLRICTAQQGLELMGPLRRLVFEAAEPGTAQSAELAEGAIRTHTATVAAPAAGASPVAEPTDATLARLRDGANGRWHLEQVLGALHRFGWDGRALMAVLPAVTRRLQLAPLAVQRQWFGAVRANWNSVTEPPGDPAFALGVAAGRLRWWSFATFCFGESLKTGEAPATLYNLAMATWQLGRHEEAERHLRRALAAAPDDHSCRRELAVLQQWRQSCRTRLGAESLLAYRDDPRALCAGLLGPHHAGALLARANDPELLRLARLRRLTSVEDARQWIARHSRHPGTLALALLHPDFGLIGVCVLEQRGNAALFHYWIAPAFQGQGHGGTALRLLKRIAVRRQIRYLFSSVFDTNTRSLNAMRRAGFAPMPGVTDHSPERLPYFCLALGGRMAPGGEERFRRLQTLLAEAGAGPALREPPPATGSDA